MRQPLPDAGHSTRYPTTGEISLPGTHSPFRYRIGPNRRHQHLKIGIYRGKASRYVLSRRYSWARIPYGLLTFPEQVYLTSEIDFFHLDLAIYSLIFYTRHESMKTDNE